LQQASRTLAIRLPYSSLERDFRRRRQAPRKRPEDDISEQRPEIGDHHAREMAAKKAFLFASYQLRVSEDWVVADAVTCEPVSGVKSLISGNLLGKSINFHPSMALAAPICSVSQPVSCTSRFEQNREFPPGEQRILGALSWPRSHEPSACSVRLQISGARLRYVLPEMGDRAAAWAVMFSPL
jgi:hypothetical protein